MEAPYFEDEEAHRFLKGRGIGTQGAYKAALRVFVEFTGMQPKELIDEAEEDRHKPRRERGKPERRLKDFYEWLTTDYVKRGGRKKGKKGLSSNRAGLYFAAIRIFYDENGFSLKVKTPKKIVKKENFKIKIRPKHIRKLLEYALSKRDKALILCQFQGGFDVSTLCSLNYGDVVKDLEDGKSPLTLHIIREKEDVEYHTFLGQDSIDALNLYLDERRNKYKEKLGWETPLFAKYYSFKKGGKKDNKNGAKRLGERMETHLIQKMFQNISVLAGIVTEEQMEVADQNPARPHALRDGFNQVLGLEGVNQLLIDYWMGHSVPYNGAYGIPEPEEQCEIYAQTEHALSVSGVVGGVSEVKELIDKMSDMRKVLTNSLNHSKELELRLEEIEAQQSVVMKVLEKLKV